MSETSKILTTDNLDAIKRYIDEQDQEIAQTCYDVIFNAIQEDIKSIPEELDKKYSKSLTELNMVLDTESVDNSIKSNRLDNIEADNEVINNILDIDVNTNTAEKYSKTILNIQKDIKNIQQYGTGSAISGLNPESISKILNDSTTTNSTLTTNSIFGKALLDLVNKNHNIDGSRIDGVLNSTVIPSLSADKITSGTFDVNRLPNGIPSTKLSWDNTVSIKNATISNSNVNSNCYSSDNGWKLNVSGNSSISNGRITWNTDSITIVKENNEFINWENIINVVDVEQRLIDKITAETEGVSVNLLKTDFLGNHTYVPDMSTGEVVTREFGAPVDEENTDVKYTVMNAVHYEDDAIKNNWIGEGFGPSYGITVNDRLNTIETDWIGEEFKPTYDSDDKRTSKTVYDTFANIETDWIGEEFKPTYETIFDVETRQDIVVRSSHNVSDEFNKIKQAIDFQTEYNADNTVKKYYSQTVRDLQDLLETDRFSTTLTSLQYPNKIEAISDVIDLQYTEDLNNNAINVKSIRLDNIERNIGDWTMETEDDTITKRILTNSDDIVVIKADVVNNTQDIANNNELIVGTNGVSTLFKSFQQQYSTDTNNLNARLLNDENAITSLQNAVNSLNGSVNNDALIAQLQAAINEGKLSDLLITKNQIDNYLTKIDAIKTYLSIDNYNKSIENYYNKTETEATINEKLKSYSTQTDVNTKLSSYLLKADATATYLSRADATATYLSRADANTNFLSKADATRDYAQLSNVYNKSEIDAKLSVVELENLLKNKFILKSDEGKFALNNTVQSLQSNIATQQNTITTLQNTLSQMQTTIATLENRIAALEPETTN